MPISKRTQIFAMVGILLICGFLAALMYLEEWPFAPSINGKSVPFVRVVPPVRAKSRTPARHVIAVSIDGLRSDAIEKLGPSRLPTLFRLRREGASTLNARTDHDYTITLPNHIAMVTGRRVVGPRGHGYRRNRMPKGDIHENRGHYVTSVFDVLHDAGLRTALYASKRKFVVFVLSYHFGGKRLSGKGTGAKESKLDLYAIHRSDAQTLPFVLRELRKHKPHFAFLHFRGTDTVGHWRRWMSSAYLREVKQQDHHLQMLLRCIETTPGLAGRTTLLVTTDHGGSGFGHSNPRKRVHYRIPWFAWGKGVTPGADLYALNPSRRSPGRLRIPYGSPLQPIRNGDIANAVASLFGLPSVPGSQIGFVHPLRLRREK